MEQQRTAAQALEQGERRLAGARISRVDCRFGAPKGALRRTTPLATAEVTDGLLQALSFSVISGSAVRDEPDAAGDLLASMAQTPPCTMDSWIQEMLRSHAVFVGDEFMGKLALPAALLWTDISGVEALHATIGRLTLLHGALGILSFLQERNRRSTQPPWEAKRAKQVKLWAAVMEKRARAHAQAKAKATVSGCATSAIVWGRFLHAWCVCALWRYMRAARFVHATVACAARILLCTGLGAWQRMRSLSFLLPGKPCVGIVCQIANVTCSSGANWRHAGVRAREDPWAALKQERARPRRRSRRRLHVGQQSTTQEHRLLGNISRAGTHSR